jgi:hypothetical protein
MLSKGRLTLEWPDAVAPGASSSSKSSSSSSPDARTVETFV